MPMTSTADFGDMIERLEDVQDYFRCQEMILDWPGARPGQRVAALAIHAYAYKRLRFPGAEELGKILGIPTDRAATIFDGLEHPPFALTKVGNDREMFVRTQTLAYVEEFEGDE